MTDACKIALRDTYKLKQFQCVFIFPLDQRIIYLHFTITTYSDIHFPTSSTEILELCKLLYIVLIVHIELHLYYKLKTTIQAIVFCHQTNCAVYEFTKYLIYIIRSL